MSHQRPKNINGLEMMKEIVAGMEDREVPIRVEGNLLRVARLDAELYQFTSNPEALVERLRASGSASTSSLSCRDCLKLRLGTHITWSGIT